MASSDPSNELATPLVTASPWWALATFSLPSLWQTASLLARQRQAPHVFNRIPRLLFSDQLASVLLLLLAVNLNAQPRWRRRRRLGIFLCEFGFGFELGLVCDMDEWLCFDCVAYISLLLLVVLLACSYRWRPAEAARDSIVPHCRVGPRFCVGM